jgi:hypothetical protein
MPQGLAGSAFTGAPLPASAPLRASRASQRRGGVMAAMPIPGEILVRCQASKSPGVGGP